MGLWLKRTIYFDGGYLAVAYSRRSGGATQLPGDWKYEDWNGDGIIDDNDVYPNVYEHTNDNGNPKMTFGATIAAEWKGFDVNLLFQGGGGFNVIYFEQLQYPLCFRWKRFGSFL